MRTFVRLVRPGLWLVRVDGRDLFVRAFAVRLRGGVAVVVHG